MRNGHDACSMSGSMNRGQRTSDTTGNVWWRIWLRYINTRNSHYMHIHHSSSLEGQEADENVEWPRVRAFALKVSQRGNPNIEMHSWHFTITDFPKVCGAHWKSSELVLQNWGITMESRAHFEEDYHHYRKLHLLMKLGPDSVCQLLLHPSSSPPWNSTSILVWAMNQHWRRLETWFYPSCGSGQSAIDDIIVSGHERMKWILKPPPDSLISADTEW